MHTHVHACVCLCVFMHACRCVPCVCVNEGEQVYVCMDGRVPACVHVCECLCVYMERERERERERQRQRQRQRERERQRTPSSLPVTINETAYHSYTYNIPFAMITKHGQKETTGVSVCLHLNCSYDTLLMLQ